MGWSLDVEWVEGVKNERGKIKLSGTNENWMNKQINGPRINPMIYLAIYSWFNSLDLVADLGMKHGQRQCPLYP